jgi:hypothetical protein
MLWNDIGRKRLKLHVRLKRHVRQEDQEVEGLDHNSHALLSYSSVRSQSLVIVTDPAEIASNYAGLLTTKKIYSESLYKTLPITCS